MKPFAILLAMAVAGATASVMFSPSDPGVELTEIEQTPAQVDHSYVMAYLSEHFAATDFQSKMFQESSGFRMVHGATNVNLYYAIYTDVTTATISYDSTNFDDMTPFLMLSRSAFYAISSDTGTSEFPRWIENCMLRMPKVSSKELSGVEAVFISDGSGCMVKLTKE